MRRSFLIRTVGSLAQTSAFVTVPVCAADQFEMRKAFDIRVGSAPNRTRPAPQARARTVRRWTHGAPDRHVDALRQSLLDWIEPYDVVILEDLADFVLFHRILRDPLVVDMDDLEIVGVMQRLRVEWTRNMRVADGGRLGWLPGPVRRLIIRLRRIPKLASKTVRSCSEWWSWRRAQQLAIRRGALLLVCSDEDAKQLGRSAAVAVVPNGFDVARAPRRRDHHPSGTTVAFWGQMTYGPNADGARWFVHEVLPVLRGLVPDIRVVIVGHGGDELGLEAEQGVEIAGFVEDLSSVLSRVDAAVIPLRMGMGTRIKILEAWAIRLPVISTTIGAHGLRARDGLDLLIADTPAGFALATHRVLANPALAHQLVEHGASRSEEFTWSRSERLLRNAVLQVIGEAKAQFSQER